MIHIRKVQEMVPYIKMFLAPEIKEYDVKMDDLYEFIIENLNFFEGEVVN